MGLSGLGAHGRPGDSAVSHPWVNMQIRDYRTLQRAAAFNDRDAKPYVIFLPNHFVRVTRSFYDAMRERAPISGGLHGVGDNLYEGAGRVPGQYAPQRVAMFGRTNTIYAMRKQAEMAAQRKIQDARRRSQFTETARPPTVSVTLAGVGLGGLCGALLAAALL